jgi:hypothetical protein
MSEEKKMSMGLLSGLKARPKAAAETPAPKADITTGSTLPEPTLLSNKEQDAAIAAPVVAPACAACGQPQIQKGLGWRCDSCYELAMSKMAGPVPAVTAEAAPPAPAIATEFALRLQGHRRAVLVAVKAQKAACDELLRIDSADYTAKQWRERAVTTIYEITALYDISEDIAPEKPAQYIAAENHTTPVNQQGSITSYDPPSPTAIWTRNSAKY